MEKLRKKIVAGYLKKILLIGGIVSFSLLSAYFFVTANVRVKNSKNRIETYSWINKNTPTDITLLTPPYLDDARYFANRGIVVDFKSFAFEERYMIEWYDRIQDVTNHVTFKFRGNRGEELVTGYCSLDDNRVIQLHEKYHFTYYVFDKTHCDKSHAFNIAHENEEFIVYALEKTQ